MNLELVHAVNTGKMSLAEAQAKQKELDAPKTAAKPSKGDKAETAAPAEK